MKISADWFLNIQERYNGIKRQILFLCAWIWRRCLFRTTFIAITGSVGKTSCKELLADILSSRYATARSRYNQNDANGVPKSLLRVRPWHRYAVLEIGAGDPNLIETCARLVKPQVAIFLSVALIHVDMFESKEAISEEKSNLLKALSPNGTAVLNKDDPWVARAKEACSGQIRWFGADPEADLRQLSIDATWPNRLTMEVQEGQSRCVVHTQLVGSHWAPSVLGAIAAARLAGFNLADVAAVITSTAPFMGRMQPIKHPTGAIIIRDENNGFMDTFEPALEMLKAAKAKRKIFITSGLSYHPKNLLGRFELLGTLAAEAADGVVFIDKRYGKYGIKAAVAAGMDPGAVRSFSSIKAVSDFMSETLQAGDLVLLKGRGTDHLTRMVYAQFGSIKCWKKRCRKRFLCDVCEELGASRPLQVAPPNPNEDN